MADNTNNPPPAEGEPKLSKSAAKKLAAKAKKEEMKAQRKAESDNNNNNNAQQGGKSEEEDVSAGNYGVLPIIQSAGDPTKRRTFEKVRDLDEKKAEQNVLVRGRVHTSRGKGNLVFLVIRQRLFTVQAVLSKGPHISKKMLQFASGIALESIVDVEATVKVTKERIDATTQHNVELNVNKLFVVSASDPKRPLEVKDAACPKSVLKQQELEIKAIEDEMKAVEEKLKGITDANSEDAKALNAQLKQLQDKRSSAQKFVKVSRNTRLDHRTLDLRTPANQAIFRVQSAIGLLFREYLIQNEFTEIHSPKLIGCASEGGAEVFKVTYFDSWAYLAQSPQLYKQMAICSDMDRVFEIGPIFRAEKSFTHRHLCEFVGLDIEMAFNEHYYEVLDMLDGMFTYIFDNLAARFAKELSIVDQQFPFAPLQYLKPTLRLNYKEGVEMLRKEGVTMGDFDDLSTANERLLGQLVKAKYNTDFYILDKFPRAVRPFYTMPDPNNPEYTNSYDIFLRGEEIMSGAQRIHDSELLTKQALEKGVKPESIKDYIDSFKYGASPHAGGGVGLERMCMLYLGLKNIRSSSMWPRDPARLTP